MDFAEQQIDVSLWMMIPFLVFGARSLFFLVGQAANLLSPESRKSPVQQPQSRLVSLIIPARDEEKNIEGALLSVLASTYPLKDIELILVNDRSSDSTLQLIEDFSQQHGHRFSPCVTVDIRSDEEKQLPGKPGALQKGMGLATGELIMMTDADCRVSPEWVASVNSIYADALAKQAPSAAPRPVLIAAYTLIRHSGPFSKIQGVEWLYTHTMASASNKLGVTLGCYGNNLTADSVLLEKTRGFLGVPFSLTEDLAFMQTANGLGAEILYPCTKETTVRTEATKTLGEYLSQHHRWAQGGQLLGWKAAAFVLSTSAVLAGVLWALATGQWLLAASFLAFRILLDSLLILPAAIKLREYSLIPWIPVSLLALIFTEIMLPFLLMKKDINWKGQRFSSKKKDRQN